MKRIGVFTSGGDAPGMNASIRAMVRMSLHHGLEVIGIRHGYRGMVEGDMIPLDSHSVSGIIQRGGTILGTSRYPEFMNKEVRARAAEVLRKAGIEGLVAIGGDGTFRGTQAFVEEHDIPIVGVPGTIDNDVGGTDFTIGFDTAVNTALDAIDKIKDTAASLERLFFVEVMGRNRGFLALAVALAAGAEAVLVPEVSTDIEALCRRIAADFQNGKRAWIVVVAEGERAGGAFKVAKFVGDRLGLDYRVAILGHIQRGGSPTARDRALASVLGAAAVEGLLSGKSGCMAGEVNHQVVYTPFSEVFDTESVLKPWLTQWALDLVDILAK